MSATKGLWVKMRVDLHTDPAVIAISAALGVSDNVTVGALFKLWAWANVQTRDGNAPGVTPAWLDRHVGLPGFAAAAAAVGWLTVSEDGISVPNYQRHNGEVVRKNAFHADRQARYRDARSVTLASRKRHASDADVTKCDGLDEDIDEEEETPPLPPLLDSMQFRDAWRRWKAHRCEMGKPLGPTARAGQLRMLAGLGHDRACAMIEHTITMGWQGLREPEPAGGGRPRPDQGARAALAARQAAARDAAARAQADGDPALAGEEWQKRRAELANSIGHGGGPP